MIDELHGILKDNSMFCETDLSAYKGCKEGQNPSITAVMCSDSRVPIQALCTDTVNRVFAIENIGNQIATAEGSVDYGVLHLKTPLLVILGHTDCGAVKAALSDFSQETEGIVRELTSLKKVVEANKELTVDEISEANVDYQIDVAMSKYSDLVASGKLNIVGLMLDFHGKYSEKDCRVFVTNINSVTDFSEIRNKMGNQEGIEMVKRLRGNKDA